MLQARLGSQADPRLYNANRDLAHCFDDLLITAAKRIEVGAWDYLQEFAKREGVKDEDLGLVCQALARFAYVQVDDPKESLNACLARCGFLDLPKAARVVVMAYLGTVILGFTWTAVHDATLGGQGPAIGYQKLRWHGHKIVKLMRMPRWRRRLYRLRRRLRAAWRAMTTADKSEG